MATRYVSQQNGNDTTGDGLSAATAWATIGKAVDVLGAIVGDITEDWTVYIGPGIYLERVALLKAGTAEYQIRWVPDPDASYLTADAPGLVRVSGVGWLAADDAGAGITSWTIVDSYTQTADRTWGIEVTLDHELELHDAERCRITHLSVYPCYTDTYKLNLWLTGNTTAIASVSGACTKDQWNHLELSSPTDWYRNADSRRWRIGVNHPVASGSLVYRATAVPSTHARASYTGRYSASAKDTYPTTGISSMYGLLGFKFEWEREARPNLPGKGVVWDFGGCNYNTLGADGQEMFVEGSWNDYAVKMSAPGGGEVKGQLCRGVAAHAAKGFDGGVGGVCIDCSALAGADSFKDAVVVRGVGMTGGDTNFVSSTCVQCIASGRFDGFASCATLNCKSFGISYGFRSCVATNCEAVTCREGFTGAGTVLKNCRAIACLHAHTGLTGTNLSELTEVYCVNPLFGVPDSVPGLYALRDGIMAHRALAPPAINDGSQLVFEVRGAFLSKVVTAGTQAAGRTYGWRFRMRASCEVTHLCLYGPATDTFTVQLWDSTGALLASASVACTDQEWAASVLASPVNLSAGALYTVSYNHEPAKTTATRGMDNARRYLHPDVTSEGGVFATAIDTYPDTDSGTNRHWLADFRWTPRTDVLDTDISGALREGGSGTLDIGPFEHPTVSLDYGTYKTLAPAYKIERAGEQRFEFWAEGGVAASRSIWVKWANVSAGLKPRIRMVGPHLSSRATTATGDGTTWEQITVNGTPSEDGPLYIYLAQRDTGATAVAYFSDLE